MDVSTRLVAAFALSSLLAPAAARWPAAPQHAFPRPTVPTEPVEVQGSVNVANAPTVDARQAGKWTVALDERSVVYIAPPAFIMKDTTYEFRWAEDRAEVYRVLDVTPGGWVYSEPVGGGPPAARRWLNPARAISIARAQR